MTFERSPGPLLRPAKSRDFVATVGLIACVAGGLSGCSDQQVPPAATVAPTAVSQLGAMVTGSARVSSTGEIEVAGPIPTQQTQINASRADSLAQVWARVFAAMARPSLERQHGTRINFPALLVCGRTFFARSPFQPLPTSIPDAVQRSFGPYWLVTLCDGSGPAISLAVSAYATDISLAGGTLHFPQFSGEEFKWVGIPAGSAGLPLPPEDAVAAEFTQTGRRVAATPELVISGRSSPQLARWHLRLDSAASVRTGRGIVSAIDVYAARRLAGDTVLAHAAPNQPTSVKVAWLSPPPMRWRGPKAPPRTTYSANATVTPGTPVVFESVVGILSSSTGH